MKFLLPLPVILLLSFGTMASPECVRASGVDETVVPSEIEWFVHIDADLLRSTESGAFLIRELQNLSPARDNPDMPVDPVLIVNGLRGLTAFGSLPDFSAGGEETDAVVVLEGTPELIQVFRGFIAGMRLEQPEMLTELQLGEQTILQLQDEDISGIFLDDNRVAIGKSLSSLSQFLAVHRGASAHVSLGSRFPTYRLGEESGIFMGAFVEGMGGFQNLPAQARILQLTQAVSLQLGEAAQQLQLLASLSTDSPQTAKQVREVLQGIIALTMITQNGQPDVATLVESARVSLEGSVVSLGFSYPVDAAEVWIGRLAQMMKDNLEPPPEADTDAPAQPAP